MLQKFLIAMSLQTGASLITLSLLLNKVSGLYGLLALLTGFHLSPIQLSMYIYSVFALILTAILAPHIRTQAPLHCLALAWFYVLDSIINAIYTALFSVTWFLVVAQNSAGQNPSNAGPGAGTIDDTSGFTNPQYNVSSTDITSPAPGQDAVTPGSPTSAPAGADGSGSMRNAVLQTESMNSLGVIISLWTIRLYFCFIMLAWARFTLRQHIAVSGLKSSSYTTASPSSNLAEDPFAESKPEGQGWRGKLGRIMVSIGRTYWLGSDEDDSWMTSMGHKFRRSEEGGNTVLSKIDTQGPVERERRRRSGTGPPPLIEPLAQNPALGMPMQSMH